MGRKLIAVLGLALMFSLQSCFVYTVQVGNGAQGGASVSSWNHYLLYGLAPVGLSNPKTMAGDATDYTVINKHTFVNGLIMGITFGIYTPTTTIVKK